MKPVSIEDLKINGENEEEVIGLCELPESVQKLYQEALQKDEEGDYDEVVHKCEIIMNRYPGFSDGMYLLGRAYVQTNEPQKAKELFEKLVVIEPENNYAKAYLATSMACLGENKKAIKIFREVYPLDQYAQWLNICYGTVLEQTKDVATTRRVYLDMVQAYFDGVEEDIVVVNSTFFHLFQVDASLDYKAIEADTDAYIRFIYSVTTMDEEYQKEVLATVIGFSLKLQSRHMRNAFRKLLDNLSQNIFLQNEQAKTTIASGYCALESYELQENPQVDSFTARLMNSYFEVTFSGDEERKSELPLYKLFILRRLPDIMVQFTIMEQAYPHTWKLFEETVKDIQNNTVEVLTEKYEKEYASFNPKKTLKVLRDDINEMYMQVTEDERLEEQKNRRKEFAKIPKKKIGRNDLCPCGSGLKYKNCCGKSH
jgi:tetratricopeptide (TPR) repeat protein